jgi:hypothetical protein
MNHTPTTTGPADAGPVPCHFCSLPAEFVRHAPDASVPGNNLNECGYRPQYLCVLCARLAHYYHGNAARVEPLRDNHEVAPETATEAP